MSGVISHLYKYIYPRWLDGSLRKLRATAARRGRESRGPHITRPPSGSYSGAGEKVGHYTCFTACNKRIIDENVCKCAEERRGKVSRYVGVLAPVLETSLTE